MDAPVIIVVVAVLVAVPGMVLWRYVGSNSEEPPEGG